MIYKNETEFFTILKSSNTITGKFKFGDDPSMDLMDSVFENISFENCLIIGGDFASSGFYNCTFENVLFRESVLAAIVFKECKFIKCKFSNTELDFNMSNCEIKNFTVTEESLAIALKPWKEE